MKQLIGVCRCGGAGDAIVALGAVKGIQEKFPDAKIVAYVYGTINTWFSKCGVRTHVVSVRNIRGQAGETIRRQYQDSCDMWFDLKPVPKFYSKDTSLVTDKIEYWDEKLRHLHQGYIESCQGLGALFVSQQELLSKALGINCQLPYTGYNRKLGNYITICNEAWGQAPIKTWYPERFSEVINHLYSQGITVYQLGEEAYPTLGNAVNKSGQLTFHEACSLVSGSVLHIGIEGFWNHFCAGVGVPNITLFGPTPASFFGYSQHTNIVGKCPEYPNGCWWITNDWMLRCPLGFETNSRLCMNSIKVEDVLEAINS